jgi:4-amino-4-deoxy-L-arabinose transferase-like glycosyltransferase
MTGNTDTPSALDVQPGSHESPGPLPDSSERLWLQWLPLALASVAIALCVFWATFHPGVDEEVYQYVGYAWFAKHYRLYRDVFENKPPGVYLVWGLAWLAGDGKPFLGRLAGVIASCVAALLMARLAGRVWGRELSVLAAALLLAATCSGHLSFPFGDTEAFGVPLVLGGICLAWPRGGKPVSAVAALLSGLLCGLAMLFKQTFVIELVVAMALAAQGAQAIRQRMAQGATVLGGALVPLLVCAACFAAEGILDDAFDATVISVLQPGNCPSAGLWQRLPTAVLKVLRLLDAPVVLLLCGLAVYSLVELRRTQNRAVAATCLVWIAAVVLAIGVQGWAWSHQVRQLLPPLCLLAVGALGYPDAPEPLALAAVHARRRLAGYFAVVAMSLSIVATASNALEARHAGQTARGHAAAVEAIQSLTGPDDRIWCYPRRDLYVRARRSSGIRYTTSLVLMRPGAQEEVLAGLGSGTVRLVAIHWVDVQGGRDVDHAFAGDVRIAFQRKLAAVLAEHFAFRCRAGDWDLFEFRSEQAPP